MSENNNIDAQVPVEAAGHHCRDNAPQSVEEFVDHPVSARRWWINLAVQPLLLLTCGAFLFAGLGLAQKLQWMPGSGGSSAAAGGHNHAGSSKYICPMMCTPPQDEPGRCPVCAMELVPAASGSGNTDGRSIHVDPATRRVANIQTVLAKAMPMEHTIRAVGKLGYDEGTLRTISAWVNGRIEKLYADYTGVVVQKGDQLALMYSPRLYTAQVELLLARKARDNSSSVVLQGVAQSGRELYDNAKQRLLELGMTRDQVDDLERNGTASSRMTLQAPISGTVIEKNAVEGQYVSEGDVIFQLADLSTVWLMLELFPEDAAMICYGQRVQAEVQSWPGRLFEGRVAFLDPTVDPATRTVGVRVLIPNSEGSLRVGDFAKARIQVPLGGASGNVYDAELAGRWVSPRHPHIVSDSPGACPICGIAMVPASELGFADLPGAELTAIVVPRDAVLMAGNNSVLYVETAPGRFEIRRVVLGPQFGSDIVIRQGLAEGEHVATRGNFLIDSQMQLAGNPSLIDPLKMRHMPGDQAEETILTALNELPQAEQMLAARQRICPVTRMKLGAMGTPVAVDLNGRSVLLCCRACEPTLRADPNTYITILDDSSAPLESAATVAIAQAMAALAPADREIAERQRVCPVANLRLGEMGPPKKVDVNGTPVFICCEACREALLANPQVYLNRLSEPVHDPLADDIPPLGDILFELPPAGDMELLPVDSEAVREASSPTDSHMISHPREVVR